MEPVSSRLQREIQRLANGPFPGEMVSEMGLVKLKAICPLGATEVLKNVKIVLIAVVESALSGWPATVEFATALPEWFISECAEEMSPEKAKQWVEWWRSLQPEDRLRAERERKWSLENWLYWMSPSNRKWTWWDAGVSPDNRIIDITLEIESQPFPWGAMRWLLLAAGATSVEEEE